MNSSRLLIMLLGVLPALGAAVEVNTASRAELERLSGVGVVMAERILKARATWPRKCAARARA